MRTGKIKPSELLQAPFISVKAKVVMPGTTNGKPNIKYKDEYVVAPSGKKIATYIVNQLFGSELITQTEGLDINWLMPTLSEALEKAIYQTESFRHYVEAKFAFEDQQLINSTQNVMDMINGKVDIPTASDEVVEDEE